MLEGEYRSADQRLTELVTEVGGAVRSLDKDLLGSLIQPFAYRQDVLPIPFIIFNLRVVKTRIGCHINSCTSNRP